MKKSLMFIMLLLVIFGGRTKAQTGALTVNNTSCFDADVVMIAIVPSLGYKCAAPLISNVLTVPAGTVATFTDYCDFEVTGPLWTAGFVLSPGYCSPWLPDFAWRDVRVFPSTAGSCPGGCTCPPPPCPGSVTASESGGCLGWPNPNPGCGTISVSITYLPGITPRNAVVTIW